ncbi:MAG: hypothetical protein M1833_001065 [Piccolia ochrophora]|nr:MAG: hypothetical protein M1833_001065 [Piccolia ochrophora]
MPEIGEVARIVHYLKKHLVGKTISKVQVQDDPIVYGKVGTTAAQFQQSVTGKKVVDVGQQGKMFWPPHPVLNLGMTGWIKFSNDESGHYKPTKTQDPESWPPRFWKFILETKESPKTEAAFVDPRRLARIRLLDCPGEKIKQTKPLSDNGPDPVQDKDTLTLEWFTKKVQSKRVPVKAFLLNQANISGVGNWVGDEILYHARIHPEQYTNSLSSAQTAQLHSSLIHICTTAVDLLVDSAQFPETWLENYRWDKGKKTGSKLPNGAKIVFLTVGGRTSAVVPSVQKKTGPVAGDIGGEDTEESESDDDPKPEKSESDEEEKTKPQKKTKPQPKASASKLKSQPSGQPKKEDSNPAPSASKKRKAAEKEPVATPKKAKKSAAAAAATSDDVPRRSPRVSRRG